jgi:hypothetical protein
MNDTTQAGGGTDWQSIRLALGAILLVIGGLSLMLLDGDNHATAARSSVPIAHSK